MSDLWTPQEPEAITIPHNYTPWDHQWNMWEYFQRDMPHLRGVGVWHRRAGKDISAVNLLGAKAMQRRGLYWHLFPTYQQGRKIAWDGMTSDGDRFIDTFPPDLVEAVNNTQMKVTLRGGSIYQIVGADDPDSLVGSNPVGIILSEWSLMNPKVWELLEPMLLANGGWALFIYTPRGRNHGYDTFNNAKDDPDWYCESITIDDTLRPDGNPIITPTQIEKLRKKGVPEEIIQQEYYCSFDASLVGAYYGQQMTAAKEQGRIRSVPYDPHAEVHTMWDLGMDDEMVIWFFQEVYGFWHVIDLFASSGEGLDYYIAELKRRPYISNYGNHYAPHDIEVRELGTGKSRLEQAYKKGLIFTKVKKQDVRDGINAVRNRIPTCFFDEEKCAKGIRALQEYTKEWDENNLVYKNSPKHDWTSHYADAFRTGAMGHQTRKKMDQFNKYPTHSITDYDPLDY